MKQWKCFSSKEKMEYIGIMAIYPLILLYEQIGKSVKFLNTRKRQITASILTVCLMLTMIPVMSLTASATTAHTHDEITFDPWTATDTLPTTSGNYYLVNDVTLSDFYGIPEGASINLCLNDKVIKAADGWQFIGVSSDASFTVYDCGTTDRSYSLSESDPYWVLDDEFDEAETTMLTKGGVITGMLSSGAIWNSGTLTINGGNIVGNGGNNYSSALQNDAGATLIINGGSIVGNYRNTSGGGINNWGTLTINDGIIAHNYAGDSGGIANANTGTVTMNGGSVTNNMHGGIATSGALIINGSVNISDNLIEDWTYNYETNSYDYTYYGADIRNNGSTVTLGENFVNASEDKIAVSTAKPSGTEVNTIVTCATGKANTYVKELKYVQPYEDTEYFMYAQGDNIVVSAFEPPHTHIGVEGEFAEWTATSGELTSGNYYLTESNAEALDNIIIIPENAVVNLCLNGHTLDLGSDQITVKGTLTICDCSAENTGKIISSVYGIYNLGTLTVMGGKINGNTIGINNFGTLTVSGGEVASSGYSGIYNESNGKVNVTDGKVTGASYGLNNDGGEVKVSGGIVTSNRSYGLYNDGGTISVSGGKVFTEIYGIYNSGTFYLWGSPTISGGASYAGIVNDNGSIYAHNADSTSAYEGDRLSIFVNNASTYKDTVIVNDITDANMGSFTVTNSGYHLKLVDNDLVLKKSHAHDSKTFDKEWTTKSGTIPAGNYYLTDDFSVTGVLTVASGTEVNLCLNGHTLDLGGRYILVQGTLNIYDCQGGEGAITSATSIDNEVIYNRGTVTLYSGKIVNTGTNQRCYGIYSVGGLTEIKGGRVDAAVGINNRSNGTLNVSGDAVITGSGNYGYAIINQGIVNVSGGEIVGGTFDGIYNANKLTVTGGLVRSNVMSGICNNGSSTQIAELVVTGGTVQCGYDGGSGILNEDSYCKTTVSGNALIGTDSGSGDGIEAIGGEVHILGGTVKGDYAVRNTGANVYISGGTLTGINYGSYGVYNGASVEITGGTITSKYGGVYNYSTGTVKITDCNITCSDYGIYNRGTGTVTISGGTVKATDSDSYGYGIYNYGTGTIKILDGEINGANYGIYNGDGTIEVAGGTLTGTNSYGIYSEGGYIYLSGSPTISGSDDIYRYSGEIYAHANGDINDAYEGGPLTVKIRSRFTDGVVVYEINDNNAESFSLAEGSTQTLVRVGDNLIVDGTAPTGEISIGTNHWNEFLNTITFGLFFKETQSVTITADDNFSGVKEIAYYLANGEMSKEQLDALQSTDWTEDDEFNINPENKYVIYAKITDNAGNVTYLSTNGIVLFKDTEITTGEYEYTLTTKTDIVTNIKPGSNTVASIDIEEPGGGAGNSLDYFVNTEGYIVLKGESLENFTKDWYAGDYTVTIFYNALGEEYIDGAIGDKITDTVITLTVKRFKVEKPAADSTVFTYTGSEQTYNIPESEYYTVTGNKRTNAGEQDVTVALKDTNTFEWADGTTDNLTFKFNIGKAKVTPPTIDGKVYTSETLTADVSETNLYTVTTNAGGKNVATYDVVLTLKDGANYKWDATEGVDGNKITLKFNISKATNEWTENPAIVGWTYGEAVKAPTGTAKFIEGNYGIAYYDKDKNPIGNPSDAGEYYTEIFVTPTDNFTGLSSGYLSFTIEKADLTITAKDHSITYGDAPSNNGVTYSGFVNNEEANVLGGTLGFEYSYAQYDDIGDNFTITPKGLTAANYEITFVPGKLTVKPLMIEFDWKTLSPEDLVYDGNDKKIGTTVTNKVTSGQYDLWLLVEYHGDTKNVTEEGFYAQIKGPGGEKAHNYNVDDTAKSPVYKITKATPETNFPTGFNIDTGKKLSDIDLTGFDGYTWDAPDTAVEYDVHEYSMTFTPADTRNYKTVSKMIKVTGGDITAPTGEITLKDNKWNEFLNNITFGLFFKETQSITITAADTESGVKEIAYYLATEELSIDDVKALESSKWTVYADAINIEPDNKYVVYARITDNAGNIIYINSDGIVLDSIKPVIAGVEDGKDVYGDATFTVQEEYLDTVTLDGEPIEVKDGKYSVPADNKEHTIVVTDKTGNHVTYKLTVYKNYKVSFVVDGKEIEASEIGYGKDATLPEIPAKDGYTAKWDVDGKNITADTVITAVYEKIPQSPQTGDNTNIWLWVAVMFVSGLSLFGIVITKKRKEQEAE